MYNPNQRGKKMESMAPYDTTFAPQFRLKIIGGKQVYVADNVRSGHDGQTLDQGLTETTIKSPYATYEASSASPPNGRSSAEKRNTWTSHAVLPPISPRDANHGAASYPGSRTSSNYSQNSNTKNDNTYLPKSPVILPQSEELDLLKRIANSLKNSKNLDVLKHIYNEISALHDERLTGWAFFSDIVSTFQKFQVQISYEDLTRASSQFVSPERRGTVNYEKLLSFIASAMKLGVKSDDHPQYFEPSKREYSNLDFLSINTRPSRPTDELSGAQGKLMRLVELQLSQGDGPVDLVHLSNQFSLADRLHRNTLSHGEIKEICYKNRVPLQESVINHVLDRCRTTGDGQYRWADFIDFLEKVQPVHTGLAITSKRPTEYVKHFPEPKNSWPKAEFPSNEPPSTYRHVPRPGDQHPPSAPASMAQPPQQQQNQQPAINHIPSATHRPPSHDVKVHSDAVQTDDRPANNIQQNGSEDPDSWLNRFGKLAQAIYRNDLDRNGFAKADECKWLVNEYNDIYRLDLNSQFIDQCIDNNTTKQGVDIDALLRDMLKPMSN